jgi:hypothetical protein
MFEKSTRVLYMKIFQIKTPIKRNRDKLYLFEAKKWRWVCTLWGTGQEADAFVAEPMAMSLG